MRRDQQEKIVDRTDRPKSDAALSRRTLIQAVGAGAGALALGSVAARAQNVMGPVSPPTTVTNPPRDFGPEARRRRTSGIRTSSRSIPRSMGSCSRMARSRGCGPEGSGRRAAWSGQGSYLVCSDIPNNRQLRWIEDDGRVTVFRAPSNNSNGNTFDYQGRQLSCEHLMRRVVRYEHDGSATVIADRSTASGSTRRTMPWRIRTAASGSPIRRMGGSCTKANPTSLGARTTRRPVQPDPRAAGRPGHVEARTADASLPLWTRAASSTWLRPRSRSRIRTGSLLARLEDALRRQHRQGSRRHRARAARATSMCSTSAPTTSCRTTGCSRDFMVDGVKCGPDGVRCDVDGNVWSASNAGPPSATAASPYGIRMAS